MNKTVRLYFLLVKFKNRRVISTREYMKTIVCPHVDYIEVGSDKDVHITFNRIKPVFKKRDVRTQ